MCLGVLPTNPNKAASCPSPMPEDKVAQLILHGRAPEGFARVRCGSKCEILIASKCFPLCLQTQTYVDAVGTSHLCQEQKRYPSYAISICYRRRPRFTCRV